MGTYSPLHILHYFIQKPITFLELIFNQIPHFPVPVLARSGIQVYRFSLMIYLNNALHVELTKLDKGQIYLSKIISQYIIVNPLKHILRNKNI